MKTLQLLLQVLFLYGLSAFGDFLSRWLNLTIPGSIIGFLLLLLLLSTKIIPESWVETGATALLFVLPLLFIPFNLGVMQYPELLSTTGFLLFLSVIVSTLLSMIGIGHFCQWYERSRGDWDE
ncbi:MULTISPECIES: CidA/LrgA family protein [Shouchella]|uniref:CidA/LrgA family protein n=2 Tax=Shouchella TaxID=2893057 RepID=A0ABY7W105_9BACI|nr:MULTISPECIES: CidA/LrgA family protein [Shouchella]MED4127688.1 CidA/LrgA family protein [Shouchella miscanthi]WDF02627.1 CidA/LrgA family protein [Shouchella hunanensis]